MELRQHSPEAMIIGTREIGDYFIKVSYEMNKLEIEFGKLS